MCVLLNLDVSRLTFFGNLNKHTFSMSLSPWPSRQYMTVLSMHPLTTNNEFALNYTRVVDTFIQNEFITKTDYIQTNLVELHVYLQLEDMWVWRDKSSIFPKSKTETPLGHTHEEVERNLPDCRKCRLCIEHIGLGFGRRVRVIPWTSTGVVYWNHRNDLSTWLC